MLAMQCLQQGNMQVCRGLLDKANDLSECCDQLKMNTYNNYACLFRKQGKLRVALDYLMKTIHIEESIKSAPLAADTRLNACAVLSQLGRHDQALQQAQCALILLQQELLVNGALDKQSRMANDEESVAMEKSKDADRVKVDQSSTKEKDGTTTSYERFVVLAVAHHNIGVEHEFLGNFGDSILAYRKSTRVAAVNLGEHHQITMSLNKSLRTAERKFASLKHGKSKRESKSTKKKFNLQASKNPLAARQKFHGNTHVSECKQAKPKSPTKKHEDRFDSTYAAYGRIPGVSQVRIGQLPVDVTKSLQSPKKKLNTAHFDQDVLSKDCRLPEPKLPIVIDATLDMMSARAGSSSEEDKPLDRSEARSDSDSEKSIANDSDADSEKIVNSSNDQSSLELPKLTLPLVDNIAASDQQDNELKAESKSNPLLRIDMKVSANDADIKQSNAGIVKTAIESLVDGYSRDAMRKVTHASEK